MALTSTSCSRYASDLLKARQLEANQDWAQALVAYTNAAEESPVGKKVERAEIQARIGRCLVELGRGTEALTALERALSLDPSNYDAHLRMAQLFAMAGLPDRAEPHLALASRTHPDDPEVLEVRASLYRAEDRPDLAERELQRAYELSGSESAAEQLSQLYLDEGEPKKAETLLKQAETRAPQSARLRLGLARLAETQGDTAQAEAEYRSAVAFSGTQETDERLAQFLARNGRLTEAVSTLRQLDDRQSQSTASADLELESGHPLEALRDYQLAYTRAKQASHSNDARLRTDFDRLATRIVEAHLALASNGNDSDLNSARNALQQVAGDLHESTRHLLTAEVDLRAGDVKGAEREANSSTDPITAAPVRYLRAEIAFTEAKPETAVELLESALSADPQYVPARIALASARVKEQKGDEAERAIVPVIRDEPANLQALLIYARALLLEHRYDSAQAICGRAASLDPDNAQIPMLLGDVALQQHQLGKALIEYEKAMLLDPYSEQAIERLTTVYEHGGADLALLRKLERLAQSGTASSRLMEIAGRLYAEKGRYADAARCLKRAVEMEPHRRSASTALAQVYAQMDDPSAARALLMNPELQPASEPATPLIAALRAEQSGDRALAMKRYEAAIQAGDPSGIASNNLAWLYASQREQLDEALRLARWALERNPGNARVLDTLGMVQLQKRQFSQAITSFQRSLRRAALEKNSGQEQQAIAAHLASALEQAGVSPAH